MRENIEKDDRKDLHLQPAPNVPVGHTWEQSLPVDPVEARNKTTTRRRKE